MSRKQLFAWHEPVFPLLFAQNVITTGLLCYKIWHQHRESANSGVVQAGHTHSLGYVAQLLIETAMLYTLELLVVIVLTSLHHPAKALVILSLVPTVGREVTT
ncbi:hypothetical protein CVT24_004231 [Panaeolus cyanescens]|uniref:Uncharacterized protein n=1 Tax=Panaeolus cyanescens TaxID=181874 RepID=A0A409X6K1_9AGAR|nr:hypothetical protein CVT24_004231 [Panaeolus cyanescens]